jgi:hypothetical protein
VYNLLKKRCEQCHVYGVRDAAGWGSVQDVSPMVDSEIIVPGDVESWRMWYRVAVRGDMPFNGPRLTPDEKATP